eukprot:gene26028-31867_t
MLIKHYTFYAFQGSQYMPFSHSELVLLSDLTHLLSKGRCVAALLPAGGIAFLEAASHSEEDDIATPRKLADDLYTPKLTSQAQHSGGAAAVAKSYVVDLHVLRVKRVRDIAFLNGYAEPSLIMLWEDDATWSARLAV